MISKRKFCVKNVLKQNVKCKNPKVTWVIPESDCLTTPCEGCDDECIEISLLEGCKDNKIKVIVECPDCDDCPPIIDEITFCTGDGECDQCDHCDDGICKPKCEEYCDDNGNCVSCLPGTCEDGRECINGECICPPGKVEVDGVCQDCTEDSHCGPCEVCKQGKCVAKECFNGVCDPQTEKCVDCLNSGDCEENEQCVGNECLCAPGFTYKPGEGCIPSPECTEDKDCGDCYICTEEGCVERKCPEGTVCYKDECVSLCDCDNPFCTGVDRQCIEIKPDTCACIKGDIDPCNSKPCRNGTDCGEGCGCKNGRCVSCQTLDCNTNDCSDVLGCGCKGDECEDIRYTCRGTCSHGSDCGPGCGCKNGKCVPCSSFGPSDCGEVDGCGYKNGKCQDLDEGCLDSFKINKSDSRCALEARLITSDRCQCNRITISSEVAQYTNAGARFKIQLKDGDADVHGLMNIPFLRDTGITNYAPSSGRVNVRVIERGGGTGFGETIYNEDYSLSGTDSIETELLPVIPREGVTGIDVVFTIPKKSLKFDSGCSFSEEEEKITYKLNSVGRNGFIKYENLNSSNTKYKVLESSDSRTPIFTWYATSQGTEEVVRSGYSRVEGEGVYVDGWLSVSQGIRPGKYYRVESDCSCEKETTLVCPGTKTAELLTYCNPKEITKDLVYTMSNCYKTIDFKEAYNTFPVCEANSRILQPYELYLNGEKKGSFPGINMQVNISGTFTLSEPIETIEIRLAGNNCKGCYEPVRITGTTFEVEEVEYLCDEGRLGYSITGGSGDVRVYVDGDKTKEAKDLPKGEYVITFEDRQSGCKQDRSIKVDCCDSFNIGVGNVERCEDSAPVAGFTITYGESPYSIKLIQDGNIIEEFQTSDTLFTWDLPIETTGTVEVEAEDAMGCTSSNIFKIDTIDSPTVTVDNTTYCDGDSTIDVLFTLNKKATVTITNSGTVEYSETKEGNFSVTLDIKSSKNYEVRVERDGCEALSSFNIEELPCPDPVVNTSNEEVCQNEPIIVSAQAISGTPPYSWTIEQDGSVIANGEGGEIEYETGIISNEAEFEFTIKFTDHHGKTGTGIQKIKVLGALDERCIDCPPAPNTQISGGTGRTVDIGQNVMLTHTNASTTYLSYSWRKDGAVVGTQKSYFFNATDLDVGSATYTLKYEYAPNCFAETNMHVVTVTEENCECDVSMKVLSGVQNLNGKTVTLANSTNPGRVCALGNQEIAVEAQVGQNCKEGGTAQVTWKLQRRKELSPGVIQVSTVTTGYEYDNTFKYTPVQTDSGTTLILSMSVKNGNCVTTATGFSAPVSLCAGSQPFDVSITDVDDICVTEANSVPFTFKVNARPQGSSYDTFPFTWKILAGITTLMNGSETGSWNGGTKTITKNLNLAPHTGNNTITVEVRRTDTMLTVEEYIFVRVNNIDSLACTACAERQTSLSLTGAPNDQVEIVSGQYTNVVASAASNVQTSFTYEWKRGSTVVSTGKTLSVNPTTTTKYTVTATDGSGCTASRTITVNVKEACSDPSPLDFSISYNGFSGEPYIVCPGEEISIVPIYDNNALPPTLYVNGTGVSIPSNNIVKVPMSVTPMTVKLEGRKREDCDAKTITKNIAVQSACGCTLSSFGIDTPAGVCPGTPIDLTVLPNGQDDGYTYTWYSDPGYSNSVNIGDKYEGYTLNGYDPESIYVEATKSGCTPIRRAVQINPHGCGVSSGSIGDIHIYRPSTGEVELTTFRFSVGAKCGIDSIEKLVATYSGGITFDLKSYATVSPNQFGGYNIEATFPPDTRVPACTNGSDTVEGVDAEFNMTGGGICKLKRNFGKVCSETPGLSCNNC